MICGESDAEIKRLAADSCFRDGEILDSEIALSSSGMLLWTETERFYVEIRFNEWKW